MCAEIIYFRFLIGNIHDNTILYSVVVLLREYFSHKLYLLPWKNGSWGGGIQNSVDFIESIFIQNYILHKIELKSILSQGVSSIFHLLLVQ